MKGESQYKKGFWTVEEDKILMDYISVHGKERWSRVAKMTGLKRNGKSCRLRWINYLSPSVKKGDFSEQEEDLIIRLHKLLGNRWSLIAGRVPGRTDNQVKNHWNIYLSKKLGIQKGKNNASRSMSSSTPSTDYQEEGETLELSKASNPCYGGTDGSIEPIVNKGSESVEETSNSQEPAPSECFMGSFWFSSDYLSLNTPELMELPDWCPLDWA